MTMPKKIKTKFLWKIIRSFQIEIENKHFTLTTSIVILSFLCITILKLNLLAGLIIISLLVIFSLKFGTEYYNDILELKNKLSGYQALFVEYKKQELKSRLVNWQAE